MWIALRQAKSTGVNDEQKILGTPIATVVSNFVLHLTFHKLHQRQSIGSRLNTNKTNMSLNMPAAHTTVRHCVCILFVTLLALLITIPNECAIAAPANALVIQDPNDKAKDTINEQTIYIPYDKLRDIFERDGRGVFLPYEEFQKLWTEARQRQPKPADTSAPLGALITDIESVASLGQEIVSVDAMLKIELLRKGWHRVPLRLGDAAIRSATIGDDPARVVSTDDGQYELLIEHNADAPETITLSLSYAKALDKTRGQSTVSFQSPQAPVNRWTIRSGQKDIDVEIEPMIAASKKSGCRSERKKRPVG